MIKCLAISVQLSSSWSLFVMLGGDTGDSYDNSDTVKSSTCGSQSPFSLTSSKDVVWIRFKTDSFNSNHGFVAGYVLYDSKGKCATSKFCSIVYFGDARVMVLLRLPAPVLKYKLT